MTALVRGAQRRLGWLALTLAGFASMAATPAQAQTAQAQSATLAADTGLLDDTASPTVIGDGDARFRQLYAEWKALDSAHPGSRVAPVRKPVVTVPSGMPLSDTRLSSSYGMRTHPVLGGQRRHTGIDLAAPTGTPIRATADGRVSMAKFYSSYGNYVQIEHGADVQTRYAHMSAIAVADGQQVRKGQIIGYVGSTGRSTGPHLHYEVRIAGQPVDPMPYMADSAAQRRFALTTGEGGKGGPE